MWQGGVDITWSFICWNSLSCDHIVLGTEVFTLRVSSRNWECEQQRTDVRRSEPLYEHTGAETVKLILCQEYQ